MIISTAISPLCLLERVWYSAISALPMMTGYIRVGLLGTRAVFVASILCTTVVLSTSTSLQMALQMSTTLWLPNLRKLPFTLSNWVTIGLLCMRMIKMARFAGSDSTESEMLVTMVKGCCNKVAAIIWFLSIVNLSKWAQRCQRGSFKILSSCHLLTD